MNKQVLDLLEEFYKGYGFADEIGNAYLAKFSSRLSNFDFIAVLKTAMCLYPRQFALDFILSSSLLWVDQPPRIWVNLLTSDDLRKNASKECEQNARFADIELLSRYVQVDALSNFMAAGVSIEHKKFTLAYFNEYRHGLVPSERDDDELDDKYFVGKPSLDKT